MTPIERLMLEAIPGPRLPRVYCGDGPTGQLMARERQQKMWAAAHPNDTTVDLPVIAPVVHLPAPVAVGDENNGEVAL